MKIAILPNLNKKDAHENTVKIIKCLIDLKTDVFMYSKYKDYFNFEQISFYDDFFIMMKECDTVIVVGGDGSIIHAAKHAAVEQKPVLGINLGRIGFVAGLEMNELSRLSDLVNGNYNTEKRMLLEITVKQNNNNEQKIFALNDAVISRGSLSRIIDLSVACNNSEISHYRADGIILSTPTGSTAYSLSAGGPVVEPQMRCMILTPICAHSLFSRSVIFSDKSSLCVTSEDRDLFNEMYLSVDGEVSIKLEGDFRIEVKPSEIEVILVKLKNTNFYSVLNDKLSERRI